MGGTKLALLERATQEVCAVDGGQATTVYKVSSYAKDRARLNGAQKLMGILISIGEAVAYALSGMYDSINQLGTGNAILIMLQLFLVGHSVLVGGLAYYVTAPSSLADVLANPLKHCSMWSLCCQHLLSSLKHGLKFLVSRNNQLW
jgi:hypothetical protein